MLAERRGGGSRAGRARRLSGTFDQRAARSRQAVQSRPLPRDGPRADRRDASRSSCASRAASATNGGIGALGLVFDREWAPLISRREEYDAAQIPRADRASPIAPGRSLGEFLLEIAQRTHFEPARLSPRVVPICSATPRRATSFIRCRSMDGRVAIAAIGSGFEGSGDPSVRSKRQRVRHGSAADAGARRCALTTFDLDRDGPGRLLRRMPARRFPRPRGRAI